MIDRAKAYHVLAFVRLLKDPKGVSILSRPCIKWLPWQEKFFTDIFATVNKDGTRQYREAFVRSQGRTEKPRP